MRFGKGILLRNTVSQEVAKDLSKIFNLIGKFSSGAGQNLVLSGVKIGQSVNVRIWPG